MNLPQSGLPAFGARAKFADRFGLDLQAMHESFDTTGDQCLAELHAVRPGEKSSAALRVSKMSSIAYRVAGPVGDGTADAESACLKCSRPSIRYIAGTMNSVNNVPIAMPVKITSPI